MSDEYKESEHEDDIVLEPDPDTNEEAGNAQTIKKLRQKLKEAQDEAKENLNGWQRARADYSNLQKQTEEERRSFKKRFIRGVVADLLPPLDTFEMAMSNKESWEAVDEKWRKGIEYIHTQFMQLLESYDVQHIEPQPGDVFDPEKHESLETLPTEDADQDGIIASCMQKGYELDGYIIRPAKVTFYTLQSK